MAKKVRIVLHQGVVRSELLNGAGIASVCQGVAQGMAAQSGEGYIVERRQLSTRTGFLVKPATEAAAYDNEQNNTLAKASRRRHRE
jgi:hypothetical protein